MSDPRWSWSAERVIPSEPGAGKAVLEEVLRRLEENDWVQHDIFGVHLAMEEALVNAIKHGNGHDIRKQVRVQCQVSPERVRIEIADEGPGFNPDDVPDPTDEENLDMPSGRGIMLMRSFMSRVQYNDRGNCVSMEKDRDARPAALIDNHEASS
jgi:serine/threonine-protein kinase RsbW